MANRTITSLTAAASPTATWVVAADDSAGTITRKVTLQQIVGFVPDATTSTKGQVIVGAGLSVSSGTVSADVRSVAGKTGTVTLVKGDVGLGNVDNTSDASKPVSTATQTALDGKAASSHTHGNITNAGAIGSTANLPIITTTSGVLTAGAFGTTANSFCQGNDSRLSDSRTPTAHKTSHAIGGSDVLSPADIGAPASNTTGITGADAITNIVSLTQAEYDAITTPNASTLYIIT